MLRSSTASAGSPVSSCSSRRAAAIGDSPGSSPPLAAPRKLSGRQGHASGAAGPGGAGRGTARALPGDAGATPESSVWLSFFATESLKRLVIPGSLRTHTNHDPGISILVQAYVLLLWTWGSHSRGVSLTRCVSNEVSWSLIVP